MARKNDLRKQREGTVINAISKIQEERAAQALEIVVKNVSRKFKLQLAYERQWLLTDVVSKLKPNHPEVEFHCYFSRSSMRPDGGILSIVDKINNQYPILITEVKNQGTNVQRLAEGKPKQAKGNAIERLGKNVIGFRTAFMKESIFPFICFGDGCDFSDDSTIIDRVVTIAMFGKLNVIRVHNEGEGKNFNRGSFFFREKQWTATEMAEEMSKIVESSIYYYYSKYGEAKFKKLDEE